MPDRRVGNNAEFRRFMVQPLPQKFCWWRCKMPARGGGPLTAIAQGNRLPGNGALPGALNALDSGQKKCRSRPVKTHPALTQVAKPRPHRLDMGGKLGHPRPLPQQYRPAQTDKHDIVPRHRCAKRLHLAQTTNVARK